MHVGGITVDLNWFAQLILSVFVIAIGVLYAVRSTASKYFEVDASFERSHQNNATMPSVSVEPDSCVVCGNPGNKKCSRCKSARYCSQDCQKSDWQSGHKTKCKAPVRSTQSLKSSGLALVPERGTSKIVKKPKEILFPYDEFVELFKWDKPGFVPCGLLNCGNSCFANAVLQCLMSTRPLVAFVLNKGHKRECGRNDWCFFCEFQTLVERASQNPNPFSPISILSRLPNMGGGLGYGRQEDAHEFMRFAIDAMQSACLDDYGGEKAVPPMSQETTLIQHIFGGHLQSQVACTRCNKISNQYENMMDLTVEIHGDAESLEECLDQFTAKEWLHGENMYKCDGCNDYVKAWKRLMVRRPPNILTIALKRFQSGRFGKLNKRVSFPETLNLSPYLSEEGDGTDIYSLYAVVVHIDMLNASFFGHYICYTKDFQGKWYRIDDSKVVRVDLDEVLSQGAYMLLYSRIHARSSSLRIDELQEEDQEKAIKMDIEHAQKEPVGTIFSKESIRTTTSNGLNLFSSSNSGEESGSEKDSAAIQINQEPLRAHNEAVGVLIGDSRSSSNAENDGSYIRIDQRVNGCGDGEGSSVAGISNLARERNQQDVVMLESDQSFFHAEMVGVCENGSSGPVVMDDDSVSTKVTNNEEHSSTMDGTIHSNGSCDVRVEALPGTHNLRFRPSSSWRPGPING